jgi:hypothetical protein
MAKHDHCPIKDIRREVEKRLQLPAFVPQSYHKEEYVEEFWDRVAKAGLLHEALALYDQILAERRAWARVPRERKQEFALRIEQEGRQGEAERLRAELLASGMSQRECQVALVERLQPLDGTRTRAWETPDSWQNGRLFRSKEGEKRLVALIRKHDGKDEDDTGAEAQQRYWGAAHRRDERQALSAARQRARAVKRAEVPDVARPRTIGTQSCLS